MARRPRLPRSAVPLPRAAGLHVERDGDVRLLAEAAAVRPHPRELAKDADQRSATRPGPPPSWSTRSALHTVATFQKSREDVIDRQQEELLELSTPVVKLWDGVLALPMIGTLDSARTQVVMESLLQRIVETGSEIAIIDITGVPTVDTLVAQHLLKTVTAIRLMGADCIISGIRPQIAQTIVHLGVDLQGVTTKATLADALALAFKRSGPDGHPGEDGVAGAHGTHPHSADGRVPAGHHPGRHARPAGADAAGRPDRRRSQRTGAKGVLIDISALEMVDSFIGRMIANISRHVAHPRCAARWSSACGRPSPSRWSSSA